MRVERTHSGMNIQQVQDKTHVGQQGEIVQEGRKFDIVRWDNGKTEEVYKGDIKKV